MEEIPLECRKLSLARFPDGLVPALSPHFVCRNQYIEFSLPPQKLNPRKKETWILETLVYYRDLEALLKLPHHEFWSNLAFNRNCGIELAERFLGKAYKFYEGDSPPDDAEIKELYEKIALTVFSIYLRIGERVESSLYWIGEKTYKRLLYNYYIVTLPSLLNFISVFVKRNPKEVRNLVVTVFNTHEKYLTDTTILGIVFNQTLNSIEQELNSDSWSDASQTDLKTRLSHIISALMDLTIPVTELILAYPPIADVLHRTHKVDFRIAQFYEWNIPFLERVLESFPQEVYLKQNLVFVKFYIVKLFRLCLTSALRLKKSLACDKVADFTAALSECVHLNIFMRSYHTKYPLSSDMQAIAKEGPDIDLSVIEQLMKNLQIVSRTSITSEPSPIVALNSHASSVGSTNSAKVSQVKNCFPNLEDSFILGCLKHFNYSPSDTINAILDGDVPDYLISLTNK